MVRRLRQPEPGHIAVYTLVIARFYQISLVPDAKTAIAGDFPIEAPPCFQMRIVLTACEAFQLLVRAPVADGDGFAKSVARKRLSTQIAILRVGFQYAIHGDVRLSDPCQLGQLAPRIDPRSDQENHKVTVDVGGIAPVENRHDTLLSACSDRIYAIVYRTVAKYPNNVR